MLAKCVSYTNVKRMNVLARHSYGETLQLYKFFLWLLAQFILSINTMSATTANFYCG